MKKITATYSEVKNAIVEVKKLTANNFGIKYSSINLNNSYYQDFGIYEIEWDFFLEKFEEKFSSNLDGLIYGRFFPEVGDQILYFKAILKIIFYKFISLFNKKYKDELVRLNSKWKNGFFEKLTVGDIVLSVLAKKFVERKDITLVLTK